MDIRITHSAPRATAAEVPDFPMVRFDSQLLVYQEGLINGQYLVANTSAMGRPKPAEWLWSGLNGGAESAPSAVRPLRTRQHAFQVEIDGQLLVDRWEWAGEHELDPGLPGCRESVVVLRHAQRPVTVEVHTRLDGSSFLARWLVIINTGDRPAALAQVFPWSGQLFQEIGHPWVTTELNALSGSPFSLGRFVNSDPGEEGAFDWMDLPNGSYGFESLNGRSGWGAPFCIVRNQVTGEAMVASFGWSGNWQIDFFSDDEPARRQPQRTARLYARIGLAGPAPLHVLEPGESVVTPEVHFSFLFGDLDACVQALHEHERRSVIPREPDGKTGLVELNHTGYTRNLQVTAWQLRQEIDMAADVGVELFMLDAGWFGDVSELWFQAVGDWDRESPLLQPDGVKGIFDYAHARGLQVGLWIEAERMGQASQVLVQHPDWQMQKRGQKIPNLDLSRPEVAQHLQDIICGAIERYGLDCYRLDYNIGIGEGGEALRGGFTENVLWRHYDALYRAFDSIRARYPGLLMENCSSGGGRNDLGIMRRFHFTQLTDKWSPGPQLKILNGMTMALPPEACEVHLGAINDGLADIDFMLRIGLFGHFDLTGIFPSMDERQAAARERWRHAVSLYKDFARPMLATCRVFHHTPVQRQTEPGDWVVLEYARPDRARAYAGVFRLAGPGADAYRLFPKGLDAARRYRVTFDTAGHVREMDGGALIDGGLRVPVSGPFTSELILFEALPQAHD